MDDEGDMIMLSSEDDLREALALSAESMAFQLDVILTPLADGDFVLVDDPPPYVTPRGTDGDVSLPASMAVPQLPLAALKEPSAATTAAATPPGLEPEEYAEPEEDYEAKYAADIFDAAAAPPPLTSGQAVHLRGLGIGKYLHSNMRENDGHSWGRKNDHLNWIVEFEGPVSSGMEIHLRNRTNGQYLHSNHPEHAGFSFGGRNESGRAPPCSSSAKGSASTCTRTIPRARA